MFADERGEKFIFNYAGLGSGSLRAVAPSVRPSIFALTDTLALLPSMG